ncbi:L,D-transpeptidase catalytic domain [Natronincola peptidivorans]|uniref:L,D-transpeptidase catalytic domain n=1 Tax=Natronincola peptidivorans TaxID=426128 RepID=A0A1I0EY71_9FIRM|nr:L,D-transpeptidase [Natronincola peptidivorans]SET50427.1 L,D-transpeptidase catalytic domain [Natronincola peptidivorans]
MGDEIVIEKELLEDEIVIEKELLEGEIVIDNELLESEIVIEETHDEIEENNFKIEEEVKKEIDYKEVLKELGYYHEDYSNKEINLRNAVLRFQGDHNLKVDADFGKESTSALHKRMEDEGYKYPDIIASPPTDNEWITINKTKRILTLYRGNQVAKKYAVAIGKSSTPTPSGKYYITNKVVDPYWGGMGGKYEPQKGGAPTNPLGRRWLGISVSGGGYGIHGNAAPYSIGTNVSYGCIRMINTDVKELYNQVNVHTPVWIGSHEELKKWGVDNKSYLE